MTTDEATIEEEIVRKGKTAPRLTPDYIDSLIASENWARASDMFPGAPIVSEPNRLPITLLVSPALL